MRRFSAIVIVLAAALASCARGERVADEEAAMTPYGVWTWDDAYVVAILRSGKYTFCNRAT